MTVDTEGFLYVATAIGVQVCDQPGRVVAILRPPGTATLSNVTFGGPDRSVLYATAGDKVWKRKLRRTGLMPGTPRETTEAKALMKDSPGSNKVQGTNAIS